jgi:alpha-glucosidase
LLRKELFDMMPWWQSATLYQIYPISFSDSNSDGWGDLPGVIARLDYVASLGVDGIWLSPFYRSPWTDYGYDTIDQKDVDPRLGTLADFDQLLAKAHELGLKVLVDQVYTYTSNRHPWFLESRASLEADKANWYLWADAKPDGSPPSNWMSIFGGPAWAWDSGRRQYYMTHFLPEMPHLRVELPEVQEALLDIGRFWLDRGVDGFRLDVINLACVDPALTDNPIEDRADFIVPAQRLKGIYDASRPEALRFAGRIREMVDERPDRFLLGEIAGHAPMATAREYTHGNTALHSAYFVLGGGNEPLTAAALRIEIEGWSNDGDGWPTWSVSNHDVMRAITRAGAGLPSNALGKMLVALLIGARGTALLYQGDELGLPDALLPYEQLRDPASRRFFPDFLQRDGARTPMPWDGNLPHAGFTDGQPWLPIAKTHPSLSVATQEADTGSTLHLTRALIALRKAEPLLRQGAIAFIDSPAQLLHFTRTSDSGTIHCLFNVSADAVALDDQLNDASDILLSNALIGSSEIGACGFVIFREAKTP